MRTPELRMPGTSWADSPMKVGLGSLNPRFGVQVPGLGSLNPNSSSKFRVCLDLGVGSEWSPGSWTLNLGSSFWRPDPPGHPHRAASSWRPPQPAQPHRAATQWQARRGA